MGLRLEKIFERNETVLQVSIKIRVEDCSVLEHMLSLQKVLGISTQKTLGEQGWKGLLYLSPWRATVISIDSTGLDGPVDSPYVGWPPESLSGIHI